MILKIFNSMGETTLVNLLKRINIKKILFSLWWCNRQWCLASYIHLLSVCNCQVFRGRSSCHCINSVFSVEKCLKVETIYLYDINQWAFSRNFPIPSC